MSSLELFDVLKPLLIVVVLVAVLLVLAIAAKTLRGAPKFVTTPLLNKSEAALYQKLTPLAQLKFGPEAKVFPQVSYGEFLRSPGNKKAFWSINARRADFVITNGAFDVVAVVEYQGGGHHGKNAQARAKAMEGDRIKRQAVRSAGLLFIEVPAKYTREALEEAVSKAISEREERAAKKRAA